MKRILLPEDSTEIRSIFEQAHDEDMIVQLADGRQFILSAIDDFDLEIVQTRRNEKLMTFLEQCAQQTQTIRLDEVKRQLNVY